MRWPPRRWFVGTVRDALAALEQRAGDDDARALKILVMPGTYSEEIRPARPVVLLYDALLRFITLHLATHPGHCPPGFWAFGRPPVAVSANSAIGVPSSQLVGAQQGQAFAGQVAQPFLMDIHDLTLPCLGTAVVNR